jgi:hypothetical protein
MNPGPVHMSKGKETKCYERVIDMEPVRVPEQNETSVNIGTEPVRVADQRRVNVCERLARSVAKHRPGQWVPSVRAQQKLVVRSEPLKSAARAQY